VSQVVVGLGNPGPEYQDTRHNVGQRVVEVLAGRLRGAWGREGDTVFADVRWRGDTVHLVKPQAFMNLSGPAVRRALARLRAEPLDLVLVYDDIDLPLGTIRVRMKGGHGGHNGVRSVIETLGTDEIRRVKVGIGRPDHKGDVPDHVLTGFDPEESEIVTKAVETAADRVLELLTKPRGS
jgi:PTH1 family peptidyl-tRNA hydrolase